MRTFNEIKCSEREKSVSIRKEQNGKMIIVSGDMENISNNGKVSVSWTAPVFKTAADNLIILDGCCCCCCCDAKRLHEITIVSIEYSQWLHFYPFSFSSIYLSALVLMSDIPYFGVKTRETEESSELNTFGDSFIHSFCVNNRMLPTNI